jgi:hypothetical protein
MNWPWRSSLSWEEIGIGVTIGLALIVILIATAVFYAKFPFLSVVIKLGTWRGLEMRPDAAKRACLYQR